MKSEVFSLIASVFSALSMGIYCIRLFKRGGTRSATTWTLWFAIGTLNLASYLYVVKESPLRAIPLFVVYLGVAVVMFYSLLKHQFTKLSRVDFFCFSLALAVGVFWKTSGNPLVANLLLQSVYVVSYIPTLMGLHEERLTETKAPWALAFIAYVVMLFVIYLDWETTSWIALVHPLINGILGNGAVLFYVIRNEKLKTKQSVSQAGFELNAAELNRLIEKEMIFEVLPKKSIENRFK